MLDPNKKYYIEGCWVLGSPRNEDDVFMCGPWDKYDNSSGKIYVSGDWIPRLKYEARNKWFPYYPEEDEKLKPRQEYIEYHYDRENDIRYPGHIEIIYPHPPMYWDINGNRLPGNETLPRYVVHIPTAKEQHDANFYSSFSTSGCILPIILACIFCTICFNDGWLSWIPGIGYIIYGLWREINHKY